MSKPPPRTPEQRKRDTLARLTEDVDAWVASADPDGRPYLVPLSFLWDGATLTVATAESTPTARRLRATGRVRLGLGPTRDVVMIDGTVVAYSLETVPAELADRFAARLWDVREEPEPYAFFQITPTRIQAWRESDELAGRTLLRDGRWLV